MSMLFKRIKDWATSISAFRTGDVIPVDGPSGTAKMSKDDLLAVTAENALGSIHSLSDTATEADLIAGNFLAIDIPGVGGATKKLPGDAIAKRSSVYSERKINFVQGRWATSGGVRAIVLSSYDKWLCSQDILFLNAGDYIVYDNTTVHLKLATVVGETITEIGDYTSGTLISSSGTYVINGYSMNNITEQDLTDTSDDVVIYQVPNGIEQNVERTAVVSLPFKSGRTMDTGAVSALTNWITSGPVYLFKGQRIFYDTLNLTLTIGKQSDSGTYSFSDITNPYYIVAADGYYTVNAYHRQTPASNFTDAEIIKYTASSFIRYTSNEYTYVVVNTKKLLMESRESIQSKFTIVQNRLSGNSNSYYFHSAPALLGRGSSITWSNVTLGDMKLFQVVDGSYVEVGAINTGHTIQRDGVYFIQGYMLVESGALDEADIERIKNNVYVNQNNPRQGVLIPPTNTASYCVCRPVPVGNEHTVETTFAEEDRTTNARIFGWEYLTHWYAKVYEAKNPAIVALSGDSTTQGADPQYTGVDDNMFGIRDYMVKKIMKAGNYPLENLTVYNCGMGGRTTNEWVGNPTYGRAEWIERYPQGFLEPDMALNPDLYICGWGLNDAGKNTTELSGLTLQQRVNLFLANTIEAMERIRGSAGWNGRHGYSKTVDDMSVIICMPTVGSQSMNDGRGYYDWNQFLRYSLQEICRKYEAAFADMTTRTYAQNFMAHKNWSILNTQGKPDGLHPNIHANAQIMTLLQDLIYPVCMWDLGEIPMGANDNPRYW